MSLEILGRVYRVAGREQKYPDVQEHHRPKEHLGGVQHRPVADLAARDALAQVPPQALDDRGYELLVMVVSREASISAKMGREKDLRDPIPGPLTEEPCLWRPETPP